MLTDEGAVTTGDELTRLGWNLSAERTGHDLPTVDIDRARALSLPRPTEIFDDLPTDTGRVGPQTAENLGGDTLPLPDEPEEDVFGPDVVVAKVEGLS
jgi:hypothetical protein